LLFFYLNILKLSKYRSYIFDMEKLNLITENYRHTFIYVAQYLKNISNNVYALWEAIVGKNMAYFIN